MQTESVQLLQGKIDWSINSNPTVGRNPPATRHDRGSEGLAASDPSRWNHHAEGMAIRDGVDVEDITFWEIQGDCYLDHHDANEIPSGARAGKTSAMSVNQQLDLETMANIGRRCTMEIAEECIPEQNRLPIPILASAMAVNPAITDVLGSKLNTA
ncbi:hypothetical protein THAOC_16281 [Thalassiosira oceanica]|uniref:Uncharacterized protein n=1 Tax=Thalassiosira oceanica TaxID=159749 RepID=K0SAB5_THAOC|nr:hypothetical protein THAOC_16281 [Thalassiosira oceanica]|eukprot:EJK63083.1 hypothetical protein THAOC_16281 [Thalassiosira oceanica]